MTDFSSVSLYHWAEQTSISICPSSHPQVALPQGARTCASRPQPSGFSSAHAEASLLGSTKGAGIHPNRRQRESRAHKLHGSQTWTHILTREKWEKPPHCRVSGAEVWQQECESQEISNRGRQRADGEKPIILRPITHVSMARGAAQRGQKGHTDTARAARVTAITAAIPASVLRFSYLVTGSTMVLPARSLASTPQLLFSFTD